MDKEIWYINNIYCLFVYRFWPVESWWSWACGSIRPGSPVGSCGTMRTPWAFWLRAWGMRGSWMETSWVNQGGAGSLKSDLGYATRQNDALYVSLSFLVFFPGRGRYFTGWTVDSRQFISFWVRVFVGVRFLVTFMHWIM